jgi:hypothetical protein
MKLHHLCIDLFNVVENKIDLIELCTTCYVFG